MNTQTKEEEDHWSGKLIGKKKGSNREAPSSGVVGHPRRRGNPGMEDPSGRGIGTIPIVSENADEGPQ